MRFTLPALLPSAVCHSSGRSSGLGPSRIAADHICRDPVSKQCFMLRCPGDVCLRGRHSTVTGWAAGCGRLPHWPGPPSTLSRAPGRSAGATARCSVQLAPGRGGPAPAPGLACPAPRFHKPRLRYSCQQKLPSGAYLWGTREVGQGSVSGTCAAGRCSVDGALGRLEEMSCGVFGLEGSGSPGGCGQRRRPGDAGAHGLPLVAACGTAGVGMRAAPAERTEVG